MGMNGFISYKRRSLKDYDARATMDLSVARVPGRKGETNSLCHVTHMRYYGARHT